MFKEGLIIPRPFFQVTLQFASLLVESTMFREFVPVPDQLLSGFRFPLRVVSSKINRPRQCHEIYPVFDDPSIDSKGLDAALGEKVYLQSGRLPLFIVVRPFRGIGLDPD
jgi:hypothetical protein